MFGNGIDRVWARRISRRWQNVGKRCNFDNVRCMTTTRALGMIGMDGTPLDSRNRIFYKARFVERVRVDRGTDEKSVSILVGKRSVPLCSR